MKTFAPWGQKTNKQKKDQKIHITPSIRAISELLGKTALVLLFAKEEMEGGEITIADTFCSL